MDNNLLNWIQNWYTSQCDGAWEEYYGIKISTVSNPGWAINIDLTETALEGISFSPVKIDRSEHDWVHCRVENDRFVGHCGPLNLVELLDLFRSWVGSTESKP